MQVARKEACQLPQEKGFGSRSVYFVRPFSPTSSIPRSILFHYPCFYIFLSFFLRAPSDVSSFKGGLQATELSFFVSYRKPYFFVYVYLYTYVCMYVYTSQLSLYHIFMQQCLFFSSAFSKSRVFKCYETFSEMRYGPDIRIE